MMERFFDGAHAALRPGGKVCVIYSNYAQLVGRESGVTPMDEELTRSDRFELAYSDIAPVPLPSKVKRGEEREWKAAIIRKLTTTVCVLRKRE